MKQYLDLLQRTLDYGVTKESRAVLLSTGEKPKTKSIFGYQTRYDLGLGFPIVTTKQIPFRQIVVELLWFLTGSTNISYLKEHNCKIWDEWATEDGELGPIYGYQW